MGGIPRNNVGSEDETKFSGAPGIGDMARIKTPPRDYVCPCGVRFQSIGRRVTWCSDCRRKVGGMSKSQKEAYQKSFGE